MNKKNIIRGIQIAILALTVAAIAQELSKPKMERSWHGKVIGFIPYDFRLPTLERLKETYWNPYERHIFAPPVFGVGWSINFYSFFENLGFIRPVDISEESFLMPSEGIKQIMKSQTVDSK